MGANSRRWCLNWQSRGRRGVKRQSHEMIWLTISLPSYYSILQFFRISVNCNGFFIMSATRRRLRESTGLYELHADMCKVFSHPIRIRILNLLRKGATSVAGTAQALKIPLGTVSPHLLMMKQRRILVSRREGTQIFYRIANPKILDAFDLIQMVLCERMEDEAAMARRERPK